MDAIVQFGAGLIDELQLSLVNERGRVESSAVAALQQVPMRDVAKLVVKQRYESVDRLSTSKLEVTHEIDCPLPGAIHVPRCLPSSMAKVKMGMSVGRVTCRSLY